MRHIYPSFYHEFRCIANRCEDSCCKDWDIDVDSETEKFYQTVQGALGDKIRSLTITDEYGERVIRSGNGRCPFWNDDMLCDIYIGIGEEHLSHTCANFPRVHIDYGDFQEHLLSFACPEAARFMLREEGNPYRDFGGSEELETTDENADFTIAFVHWGTENEHMYDASQKELAGKFVEAGADLIIGAHPHVLQGFEYIEDVPVVYSMGNFWFNSKTLDSCMIRAVVNEGELEELRFIPCIQKGCYTSMVHEGDADYDRILSDEVSRSAGNVRLSDEGIITKQ